jgi:hypothetical protein
VHPHVGCVDFLFFDRVQDCLKRQFLAVEPAQVNYWEIIADNLSKAGTPVTVDMPPLTCSTM